MESASPAVKGFLLLPPSGKILKKTWQKKYCVLYKRSSTGIARIEIFDNESKTSQAKIVTLEDVIKITPKNSTVINIVTKQSDMDFGTMCEKDFDTWFEALKSVAFPNETTGNSLEQDNDLYCSTENVNNGIFYVNVYPSEASQRCNLTSKTYILVITGSALQLLNIEDNKLLYTWPFSFIRKYGYKGGKFTFEAGRKCASGEGVFYLEHRNHNEIYRCLATRMNNMKKLFNGVSMASLSDGELAALNMEAGSRNPLPATLIQPTSFQESKTSLGLNFPTSTSLIDVTKAVPPKPLRKNLTNKSSSQLATTPIVTINANHDYMDVNVNDSKPSKYDTIENRKDAWRTLGVQDPPHSETEEMYDSWGGNLLNQAISEMQFTEKATAPAMITEPPTSPTSQYYDCLQHFGSTGSLNVNSGYKKVFPQVNKSNDNLSSSPESHFNSEDVYSSWGKATAAPTVIKEPVQTTGEEGYDHLNYFGQSSGLPPNSDYKQVKSSSASSTKTTAYNLYEEVTVNDMISARSADDSHLGYALINKSSASGGTLREVETERKSFHEPKKDGSQKVTHRLTNEQLYAVVSKPKQV